MDPITRISGIHFLCIISLCSLNDRNKCVMRMQHFRSVPDNCVNRVFLLSEEEFKNLSVKFAFTDTLGVSCDVEHALVRAWFTNTLRQTITLNIRIVVTSQGSEGHKVYPYWWAPSSTFYCRKVWDFTKLWKKGVVMIYGYHNSGLDINSANWQLFDLQKGKQRIACTPYWSNKWCIPK